MQVINLKTSSVTKYTYAGRPGPLGNPFVMGRDGDRDAVCDKHEAMLRDAAADKPNTTRAARLALRAVWALPADAVLACYCAPLRCHCDTIAKIWKEMHEVGWYAWCERMRKERS